MTSYYDVTSIGISRYMMVHDRHMSVYDEDSALILVMATDVPGIRPLISGALLILPNFVTVAGCFSDWYMFAHPALLCSRLHRGKGGLRAGGVRRPLQQRGRRKAAVERIEHWPIIS